MKKRILKGGFTILLLVAIGYAGIVILFKYANNETSSRLSDARDLTHAYLRHAHENQRRITSTPEILYPKYLSDKAKLQFRDSEGKARDYVVCFSGDLNNEGHPADTIFLAAPEPIGRSNRRIVSFLDGRVESIAEEEFQKIVQQIQKDTL